MLSPGDVAWLLVSAALVLFMVPGLALFYGGMVRSKNVLNMLLMNMYCVGVVPILWAVVGYSLALTGGSGGVIGGFDAVAFDGLGSDDLLVAIFLAMFAAITPALMAGAVADRMKFSAWAILVPIWSLLVYVPVVYWIYGPEGWLLERGSLDFAGGTAIHINAGVAALAIALVLGKRKGWPGEAMPPHNLPLVMLGTGILWFGWFGFNAGSALAADGIAVQAFVNTFLAGAAGMLAWLAAEKLKDGHFTTLGAASGIVAALVAITPAAGFVDGLYGVLFGAVAGVLCFAAIQLKYKFGYDDSLDVVGVHMVGGIIGGVLLGLFANFGGGIDEAGDALGLLVGGGTELFIEQLVSIGVVLVYSFVVTFGIAKALDVTMGIRVSDEVESAGLDQADHAETAYNIGGLASGRLG